MKAIRRLIEWFIVLVSGEPHFYIGGRSNPYMLRWYLIPRNGLLNVYLHKFMRDDDDSALHDHPWWFVSVMLRGGYWETRTNSDPDIPMTNEIRTWRGTGSFAFRRATDRHRVTLSKDGDWQPIPCWTLVLTGPRVREWGFHCPKGFVPWHQFVSPVDSGEVGKGCGD